MSKIDLSKAKIGDKFRTRCDQILEYVGEDLCSFDDKYLLKDVRGRQFYFYRHGKHTLTIVDNLNLVEQVFDDEKDTTDLEIVEAMNQAIKEIPEKIAEREQELQRRQEVIALAEKLVVNEEMMKSHRDLFEAEVHDCAKTLTTYPEFVIRSAEDFIKYKNQYLKDGKL